ncbi:hypothetical protein LZC95_28810 [Pendulispora brunnea]|uniref:PEGA domain-containing protein n=1 Tax=Pendulispora brunnea TaxID=2905690 RepID=A0ABZ2JVG1_9BACT
MAWLAVCDAGRREMNEGMGGVGMRARKHFWIAVMSLGGVLAAGPAAAQETASPAETLYREGQRLLEAGSVREACIKLAESQRIEPATGTLINLATCHEKEGKTATAWMEFNRVIQEAERTNRKDRVKFAREHAVVLEQKLRKAVITLRGTQPGRVIRFAGQEFQGSISGTPVPVDPGEQEIVVSAPGKKTWTQSVTLAEGPGTSTFEVPPLEDAQEAPAAPVVLKAENTADTRQRETDRATVSSSGNAKRTVGFVVAGAGVLALGAGGFFGLRALSQNDDSNKNADAARAAFAGGNRSEALRLADKSLSDHDSAISSQTVGIIAGATGAVALGVGIYLIVTAKKTPTTAIVPMLGPNVAGASASLAF